MPLPPQKHLLSSVGFVLTILGLYSAIFLHLDFWYSLFLLGGFLFLEGINQQRGFSALKSRNWFLVTWLKFLFLTILVEIIGNYWWDLWDYPTFGSLDYLVHVLIIGYPFTGFFGLEFFALIQRFFPSRKQQNVVIPLAAFLFGYLNEYPNIFAYEWIYKNWPLGEVLGIPIMVSLLWVLLPIVLLFRER